MFLRTLGGDYVTVFALTLAVVAPVMGGVLRWVQWSRRSDDEVVRFWGQLVVINKQKYQYDRNWTRFARHVAWQLKRDHLWLSVGLHPPGDFMDSLKRLVILSTTLSLSLVCATWIHCYVSNGNNFGRYFSVCLAALCAMIASSFVPTVCRHAMARKIPRQFRFDLLSMALNEPYIQRCMLVCCTDTVLMADNMGSVLGSVLPHSDRLMKKFSMNMGLAQQDVEVSAIALELQRTPSQPTRSIPRPRGVG
eukprot:CAMPEP_0167811538 /NCGR_PEP_ID=MMETSP0112_2-20121227/733_1 /TAXON_ID=91324 /ORGANISM="Lotharella globosa, Strain CCCM811" /LENGTH=249 /DNA_ID=CAMNT_0007710279 /DNA_START=229 /DNA_END=975 /DNA_ORIENTATION=-